jgi:hypothetical protein
MHVVQLPSLLVRLYVFVVKTLLLFAPAHLPAFGKSGLSRTLVLDLLFGLDLGLVDDPVATARLMRLGARTRRGRRRRRRT